ncbi:hypothetical protein CDL15_Pgr012437 [Punica granatum]|uniref:Uncharacterized protein n=1 Tax=Punica granatum TaxID=22663 RepID=A0A218WXY5_PUNGR|nr:hypothetical protein CDL15_Pgr012437 [Punica granatum]
MLARRGRTHLVVLVDVLSCTKRRVRDRAMTLSLPRRVDRSSGHGPPCRGGRVKVTVGLPAKEFGVGRSKLPLRLWLADQFFIVLSSLLTKVIDPVVGRAFRAEPEAKRNWSDRLGWTGQSGLGRICWAGPAQTKRWAEPMRKGTPEKTKMGGKEESSDRGQRFSPLSATATARRGAGDGGNYRLGYAVLGRGVTRLGSVGIEEIFEISARFPSFPARGCRA